MKIIPTWPKVSLPRFHQTDLQDRTGHVGIIFIISALSHVLSTSLCFSLNNSFSVFSFDGTYMLLDNFQVARVFFIFSFFTIFFFPRYQFVEFATYTIWVFLHQQNYRLDIKIKTFIYIYIYI